MVMRTRTVLGTLAIIALASCGQPPADEQASSAQGATPAEMSVDDVPTRPLSPELPGDDPGFRAAADAFDGDVLEQRTIEVTGFTSNDLGAGYFGQRFFMSLWSPAPSDVAMRVCHELVAYANEIDFPATQIEVVEKTYADFEWSRDLVKVDDTGSCVAAGV